MAAERRAILLRAVNVGGARLPMDQLRDIAREIGALEVSTYIASGNLLATIPGDPAGFDRALEEAVRLRFGFDREAISRTRPQLESALRSHPFEVIESRYSYVNFLLHPPSGAAVRAARALPVGEDRWEVIGEDLHLRYARGAGQEQMRTATLLAALGVPGTARNLNTVKALIQRL